MNITMEEVRKIADIIPGYMVIYRVDDALHRIYYSKNLPGLYGYQEDEYEKFQADPMELILESDRRLIIEKMRKNLREDMESSISYRIIHKRKGNVWIRAHARNIGEMDGAPVYVVSLYDVSDEMQNNQRLLESSNQGIVVFDRKTKEVLYGNSEFFRIAGKTEVECLEKPCYEVVCGIGSWDPGKCICFKALESGEPVKNYDPESGKCFTIIAKEILWGEHDSIAFYMEDITERERSFKLAKESYESELKIRNELLKEADIYFMANLTKHQILERRFPFPVNDGAVLPCAFTNEGWDKNLESTTIEKYRENMTLYFSVESLKKAYQNGETIVKYEYFQVNPMFSKHWYSAQANLVKQPETDDLIVLIYITDRDKVYKQNLAQQSIMNEEIDFTVLIHVHTRKGRLITATNELNVDHYRDEYDYDAAMEYLLETKIAEDYREECKRTLDLDHVMQHLEENKYLVVTYNHVPENGRVLRKQVRAYYLDETKEDIVFTRRDITDTYEENLARQRELEEAVERAEKANQAKTDFLSRMSHDIRTPMNAIIGMTNLAQGEDNPPATVEYLKNIDISSHFLLGLINDILDLSKIESGHISLEPENYPLEEFTRAVNTVIKPLMDEKHIDFIYDMHCGINNAYIDRLRFNQIFFNLLSNAVKFTPEYGTVVFSAEEIPGIYGQIITRFHVKDSGIGMSQEFMKHMYDAFAQEQHGTGRAQGSAGTGLGLPIAKSLVEEMGGRISATSTLGKGTEFVIDLPIPVGKTEEKKNIETEETAVELKGCRILLAEDNQMNILVAKRLLAKKGIEIEVAMDGREAVELFGDSSLDYYDAILMDVRMPVMDGLEATQRIRKMERPDAKKIPIIAMTADSFSEDKKKTLGVGMNAHLSKPIEPKLLYQTLQDIMKESKKCNCSVPH